MRVWEGLVAEVCFFLLQGPEAGLELKDGCRSPARQRTHMQEYRVKIDSVECGSPVSAALAQVVNRASPYLNAKICVASILGAQVQVLVAVVQGTQLVATERRDACASVAKKKIVGVLIFGRHWVEPRKKY